MRRVAWAVLTGLGVFFIMLAVLSRFFVPAQAVKFPLNEYTKTTLQANNASYFSSKSVTELSGVTLQTTTTTKGDVAAAKSVGSSKVAVWQTYSAVEDITNHAAVSIPVDGNSLAFDRKTGVLVPWSGNTVAGKPVNISGQEQGSLFPLGTQKKDYQVFDTTLLRPVTFHYTGTATTDGVATYVFVANVPATQVGTKSLPGALVGACRGPERAADAAGQCQYHSSGPAQRGLQDDASQRCVACEDSQGRHYQDQRAEGDRPDRGGLARRHPAGHRPGAQSAAAGG